MRIKVKVIPNASRNEIVEVREDFIKVKVAAPPERGKANKELLKFLKSLGIKARIISGETSRTKLIEVEGDLKKVL